MTEPVRFTDEDLTAYLDGEAAPDLSAALEAALAEDDALAKRVRDLDVPVDAIRDAFDAQLAAAPAMPEMSGMASVTDIPEIRAASSRKGWRGFMPGLGVGLAAGLAGALYLAPTPQEPSAPGWLEIVANYQMLYVPETLYGPNPAQGRDRAYETAQLTRLSQAVDLDLTPLLDVPGLTFKRAQQLGFRGKTLIQVAYALPDGTPVAICILPSTKPQQAVRTQELSGMAAGDWTTGQHGILVIGGQDQGVITTLSQQVQTLL